LIEIDIDKDESWLHTLVITGRRRAAADIKKTICI
jgi:hypothetical protein